MNSWCSFSHDVTPGFMRFFPYPFPSPLPLPLLPCVLLSLSPFPFLFSRCLCSLFTLRNTL